MKLKAKTRTMFFKFDEIGDTCEGEFVEFNEGVPSKFGEEDNLILKGDDGPICIRCTTKLKAIIKDNIEAFVEGARVTIKFSGEIPSAKGNPTKDYEVDVEPAAPGRSKSKAPDDAANTNGDEIPF